jgi:hypothetical protein
MKNRIPSLFVCASVLCWGCAPQSKTEFLDELHALIEVEISPTSAGFFTLSATERDRRVNKYLTVYYEDFAAELSPAEKSAVFGEVALYYLHRSGLNADSAISEQMRLLAPAADSLVATHADSLDQSYQRMGKTLKMSGQIAFDASRALWHAVKKVAENQRRRDSIRRADSTHHADSLIIQRR